MSTQLPHYDRITQAFHWAMASGLLYMMLIVVVRATAEDSALYDVIWPWHKPLGFLMGVMIIWRLVWLLNNHFLRPRATNIASRVLHIGMYFMMALVPLLALLRQHGSGREFSPFGIPLMSAKQEEIEWMVTLGNQLHGLLGWVLMGMIAIHVFAVIFHMVRGERHVVQRMTRPN